MCFKGFDLGIKDKNGKSICVGDKISYTSYFEDVLKDLTGIKGCPRIGEVIYYPKKFCFAIKWKEPINITLLSNLCGTDFGCMEIAE